MTGDVPDVLGPPAAEYLPLEGARRRRWGEKQKKNERKKSRKTSAPLEFISRGWPSAERNVPVVLVVVAVVVVVVVVAVAVAVAVAVVDRLSLFFLPSSSSSSSS